MNPIAASVSRAPALLAGDFRIADVTWDAVRRGTDAFPASHPA